MALQALYFTHVTLYYLVACSVLPVKCFMYTLHACIVDVQSLASLISRLEISDQTKGRWRWGIAPAISPG